MLGAVKGNSWDECACTEIRVHTNIDSVCIIDGIDPGILGITFYLVLVPRFPVLY